MKNFSALVVVAAISGALLLLGGLRDLNQVRAAQPAPLSGPEDLKSIFVLWGSGLAIQH